MQKVLFFLAMAASASVIAQTPPPALPKPPGAAAAAKPPSAVPPGVAPRQSVPAMPTAPTAGPAMGGAANARQSVDPFKPNPVVPPPSATPSPAPEMMMPPEPPKTPVLGVNSDGRTFIGVVGENKALYKTGDGYVYEQISNP